MFKEHVTSGRVLGSPYQSSVIERELEVQYTGIFLEPFSSSRYGHNLQLDPAVRANGGPFWKMPDLAIEWDRQMKQCGDSG